MTDLFGLDDRSYCRYTSAGPLTPQAFTAKTRTQALKPGATDAPASVAAPRAVRANRSAPPWVEPAWIM